MHLYCSFGEVVGGGPAQEVDVREEKWTLTINFGNFRVGVNSPAQKGIYTVYLHRSTTKHTLFEGYGLEISQLPDVSSSWQRVTARFPSPSCIGGSVVEFSPATREARVRFPANALTVFNIHCVKAEPNQEEEYLRYGG